MATTRSKVRQRAIKAGYRSGLEETVANFFQKMGVDAKYEATKIKYRVEEDRTYTPDFILPNGIIVETKGRFVLADRKKHLLIQKQHPELDIRFIFSNSGARLSKASKTTYADWCDKHGFVYSNKEVPQEWLTR